MREYSAADYDEVFLEIAEYAGYPADEVAEIVGEFLADMTLAARYVPMRNPTPQVEGPVKLVQARYEKGPLRGQPRMTLHSWSSSKTTKPPKRSRGLC